MRNENEGIKMNVDYTLYLVTDRRLMSTPTLPDAVEQAILGGCTMVQLREKDASASSFFKLAEEIKQITDRYEVPLIINDRIDIALAVGAAGVHVGQNDIPASAVRNIIPHNMLLGVSAASVDEAIHAQRDGADYLGIGAMFPTGTKDDARAVTMDELRKIKQAVTIPIVAIGGINKHNIDSFPPMNIDGVAIVSAIIAESDIKGAATQLKCLFQQEDQNTR
ncbi:thiamine phosphate synthase [Paenibacillus turicensis]|uniref:thiamine phosphate synthase n=1 Tax=Paenibacillus turicensis TaxID=160487 RepID=UPI003D2E6293